jgi:hypothetical protein
MLMDREARAPSCGIPVLETCDHLLAKVLPLLSKLMVERSSRATATWHVIIKNLFESYHSGGEYG